MCASCPQLIRIHLQRLTSEIGQIADILCVMQQQQYPGQMFDKNWFRNIVRGVNGENIVQEDIGRDTIRRYANLCKAYIALT